MFLACIHVHGYTFVYLCIYIIFMSLHIYVMYKCEYSHLCLFIFTCCIYIYNIHLLQKKYIHTMKHTRTESRNTCLCQRWNGIHSLTLWHSKFWKTLDFGGDVWKHQSTFAMTMTAQTSTLHHTIKYLITNSSTMPRKKLTMASQKKIIK